MISHELLNEDFCESSCAYIIIKLYIIINAV